MLNEKNFREAFEPLHASDATVKEVLKMTEKKETRRNGWVLRAALAAALVACLMASLSVAFAGMNGPNDLAVEYEPFQPGVFESEEEFLNAIFGLTGYDHVPESVVCDCSDPDNHLEGHKVEWVYSVDRVALDTEVAETLKSYITHVGQSMTWNGYTLTIDSMFYDKVTGFCALGYTFEHPENELGFEITPNGGFVNYYFTAFWGSNYIVADKSTDTKVTAIAVSCSVEEWETYEIEFNLGVEAGMNMDEMNDVVAGYINDGNPLELNRWTDFLEESPYTMEVRIGTPDVMENIIISEGEAEIVVTPVGIRYKVADSHAAEDHSVIIRFSDGTEYLVVDEPKWERGTVWYKVQNYLTLNDSEYTRYAFNRLVDLDDVVSVVLDGAEYYVN